MTQDEPPRIQQQRREGEVGGEVAGRPQELEEGSGRAQSEAVEEWRPVRGYEGLYEVSSLGSVRSVNRIQPHGVSGFMRTLRGRVIKGWVNCKGYKLVAMSKDGMVEKKTVHSIVCDAFYPESLDRECTNHIDGDKLNNRADNIEPSTYSENNRHAYRTGLKPPVITYGEQQGNSKLTNRMVLAARDRYFIKGERFVDLANEYGVSDTTISRAILGISWKRA